jgi:hypothetical protein
MNTAPVASALKPFLSKLAILGFKRWLASVLFLSGVWVGLLLAFAIVWTVTVAPEVAIGLIAEVS